MKLPTIPLILGSALLALSTPAFSQPADAPPAKEPAKGKNKNAGKAASEFKPDSTPVYKTIGDVTLKLHVFNPPDHKPEAKSPAIVFFFGGGFRSGAPTQFYAHSHYLASRGLVAIAAEYRIKNTHGTDPLKSVADAKSAIRWIRSHATGLGIDPDRLAAGGGSAGGYLAAATATLAKDNEPGEDTTINAKPNALVIFNGVFDIGPYSKSAGETAKQIGDGDAWKDYSPLQNVAAPFPPTVFFLGTKDKLIPASEAERFKDEVEKVGGRFDLHLYEGQTHGFFNYNRGGGEHYRITLTETDKFVASLGWITGEPTVKP